MPVWCGWTHCNRGKVRSIILVTENALPRSQFIEKVKKKGWNKFTKYECEKIAAVFNNPNSSKEEIYEHGCEFFCHLYRGSKNIMNEGINYLRYLLFIRSKLGIKLKSLRPTAEAARQHLYRVYSIVQKWLGKDLDPTAWGWKKEDNEYVPIESEQDAAPPKLLKTIFCKSTPGCSRRCTCRKLGWKLSLQ